tara:strand:+ start:829 stop:1332 length:504 start_codon:yes stop_codon:yes gene_type:complete
MVTKQDDFESEDTKEAKPSNDEGSFTLDFFDSDELEKTDLKGNCLVSQVRYITHVSISLPRKWLWTKPCKTPLASVMAAENMVCARLLWETGFVPVSDLGPEATNEWTHDVRSHYSWIHEGSRMFIGETREILLPEGMSPNRFRKNFHKVQFNSGLDDGHIGVTTWF